MPTRVIIDGRGKRSTETFEYTQEELDAQAASVAAAQAEAAAQAAARQTLSDNLAQLQPNENSMPVLKAKVNYLLEQVRLLKGV